MTGADPILILSDAAIPDLEGYLHRTGHGFERRPLLDFSAPSGPEAGYKAVVLAPAKETDLTSIIGSCRDLWPQAGILVLNDTTQPFGEGDQVIHLSGATPPDEIVRAAFGPRADQDRDSLPGRRYPFGTIVGQSGNVQHVFKLIDRVARTDSTVLITGESGTGKELIAQAIHYESFRRDKPLVPVNCGAIPEELLESELFGHEKGAFTSAIRTRIGRFELAEGGTVFLDEIGEMSPQLQVKLLRVLQEHQFERVGGTRTINVDIRVVAATNKNLKKAVEKGDFREDLYYRLDVIPIQAPALRDRVEDIPLLVEYFLKKFNKSHSDLLQGIDPEAMAMLGAYEWPGNVRELENLIERMAILCDGPRITTNDLPERFGGQVSGPVKPASTLPDQGFSLTAHLAQVEDDLIHQALEKAGGVKKKAADLLGINRTTLVEKMKKKGMM